MTTSLPSARLVRVFKQLQAEHGLPDVLRTDNDSEFLGECLTSRCLENGVMIDYIEPGKSNQNGVEPESEPHWQSDTRLQALWYGRPLRRLQYPDRESD